jgi:hypothetical protein
MAQVVATTYSCVIQVLVLNLALNSIPNVCDDQQEDHFTCPGGRVFYSGKNAPPHLKFTMLIIF